ncbi:MAG: helix-turn-helix transcriptional regulator [Clostridia bacterium]|nr:helix-turn-helix transcriptional regulator [Clostridia bacterium]
MNTIGENIRNLRKKNDLTQEKLADFLGVTYQSVSKWECGVTCPDLSLIAPLTKLLHCTADELLGLTEDDTAHRTHDEAYYAYRHCGNPAESLMHAKDALADFPDDFRYMEWLADAEYRCALTEYRTGCSAEFLGEMLGNAYRRYNYILDSCTDHECIRSAALGKILVLYFQGREEEASWSAEFEYPDPLINTTEVILELSPEGRELKALLAEEG